MPRGTAADAIQPRLDQPLAEPIRVRSHVAPRTLLAPSNVVIIRKKRERSRPEPNPKLVPKMPLRALPIVLVELNKKRLRADGQQASGFLDSSGISRRGHIPLPAPRPDHRACRLRNRQCRRWRGAGGNEGGTAPQALQELCEHADEDSTDRKRDGCARGVPDLGQAAHLSSTRLAEGAPECIVMGCAGALLACDASSGSGAWALAMAPLDRALSDHRVHQPPGQRLLRVHPASRQRHQRRALPPDAARNAHAAAGAGDEPHGHLG
jgi:hypothetical protein